MPLELGVLLPHVIDAILVIAINNQIFRIKKIIIVNVSELDICKLYFIG